MKVNFKNVAISLSFVLLGIFLISYALNRPCDIGNITQTMGEQEAVMNTPKEMSRMVCLSTDGVSVISMFIGISSIFPGVSGLHKALTEKSG